MLVYRADLYVTAMIQDFAIEAHSNELFTMLRAIPELANLSMTKQHRGNVDWYDIIGSINVPERARAFEALCKESSPREAYNLFIRIDRNITADSYEAAQLHARAWVQRVIAQPLMETFHATWVRIERPLERWNAIRGNSVR